MMHINEALTKARNEMHLAVHLSEVAPNAGLRKIYENKANYLSTLIYAASIYKKLLEGSQYG